MINQWAEECINHYIKYMREPIGHEIFSLDNDENKSIQIFCFENVFENCNIYASLGFSHFSDKYHSICEEIIVGTDYEFDKVSYLFASTLLYIGDSIGKIPVGNSKAGLSELDFDFVKSTRKDALYFTLPFIFPEGFHKTKSNGIIYMACFISQDEHEYIKKYGCDKFEEKMETSQSDPFDICRDSVV